jgi:hypothetical protein
MVLKLESIVKGGKKVVVPMDQASVPKTLWPECLIRIIRVASILLIVPEQLWE